jgi:hypothetical protein
MKWRIIIRVSLNDKKNRLRNPITKCLKDCDIKFDAKSSTWEGPAVDPQKAAEQLAEVLRILSEAPQSAAIHQTRLDHLWIYIAHAA